MATPDSTPQVAVVDEKLPPAEARSARSTSGEEPKAPGLDVDGLKSTTKKKWYKRLNPLRWQTPPPVPEERTPSKEYGASFLSVVYFQWMSPLMNVSLCQQ